MEERNEILKLSLAALMRRFASTQALSLSLSRKKTERKKIRTVMHRKHGLTRAVFKSIHR